jgi:large repetitive protein
MGNMTSQSEQLQGGGGNMPTAWWPLNQTSGKTVPDASGAGHTATASGVTWSGGAENGGVVSTAGPVLDTTGSFTVSAWVNPTITSGTQTAVSQNGQLCQPDTPPTCPITNSAFTLGFAPAGQFGLTPSWSFGRPLTTSSSSGFASATSSAGPTAGTWTHLVGVYNASTGAMTLYVNGASAGTATDTTPTSSNGKLTIGQGETVEGSGYTSFDGGVSDVQVYQQALTSAQVTALYGQGRLSGASPTNKLTTTWTLDQRGLPTSMTDPNNNVTYYSYDQAGRLAQTTDPAMTTQVAGGSAVSSVPVTMTGYDTFGEPAESSDANANETVTAYDADGNPVSVTNPSYTPPGGSPIVAVSKDAYNSLGELTSETDPLNHATSYTYDQLGDVATQTNPDGGVTSYSYDTNGDQLAVTGPTGAQSQATYDYLGRMVTSTQDERYPSAAAYTTGYSYNDPGGWLQAQTSPDNVKTSYTYDPAGEQASVTDGANNTTQYQYNAAGDLTATMHPDGMSTTASYDEAGRQTGTADVATGSGTVLRSASAAYDGDGDPVTSTDYRNNSTTFSYNADGLLTQEVEPVTATSSITTSFGYDQAGNQTRYTDGNGNAWWTTYNSWNLPSSKVEPATAAYPTGSTFGLAYDADGRPTTETQPGGATVTDSYDSMSDLTGQSGTGASAATATRTFGYDKAGDLTSASTTAAGSQAATSESFGYDDRGLLLSATGTAGSSSMAYNGDGQVTSVADAAGTTGYGYDTAGRLATLTDPATGTILSYSYNSMDEVAQVSYGSGGDIRSFGYNGLNQLTSDKLATSGGATVASISYGYDPNGNLTSKTTTGFAGAAANTYSYDEANRLTSWNNGATTTNYSYDAAGNLTKDGSKTYTYDARDELTSDGTNTYNYAANGTLASEVTPGGTVTSTTDAYGQQVSSGAESFGSDALGRTVSVAGSAQVSATLSYAGSSALVASDGTSAYSWDPSGNLTGVKQGGSGVLAYTDAHTDVVGDFTAKGTALSGSAAFDPWGTVLATSGTVSGRLGFQSQYTDPASGQVDMGARWYSPARAGFDNADTVSVDPVPNAAAGNPFAYVADNPLDGMDPSGHMMITGGGSAPGSLAEQKATHPCNSACEAHPPQPVSAAQQRKMLAHDNELRAQAAARERAARARAKARAKAHHSCGWLSLSCDLHKAEKLGAKLRHDAAAAADATVRAVSDAADDTYDDVLRPGMALAIRLARDEVTAVVDAAQYGIHAAGTVISYAAQAGSRVYHAVTKVAEKVVHEAVHVVKTAYHEAAKAATATVAFVKRHAATITSIVVGVVVFAGCEAVTAGVGTIGCAALAGAASNMASYAVTAAQTGHFSVGGLLMAGATGALVGAATAGILQGASALAGGLLGSGAEAGARTMAEDAASTATDETTESTASSADAGGEPAAADTGGGEGSTSGLKQLGDALQKLSDEGSEKLETDSSLHDAAETAGHAAEKTLDYVDRGPEATGSHQGTPHEPIIAPGTPVGHGFSIEGAAVAVTVTVRFIWEAAGRWLSRR